MKFFSGTTLLLFTLFLTPTLKIYAQSFKNAGEYMSFISNLHREITKNYLSYSSSVAHGKSARKVENKRQELIKSVVNSKKKIAKMPTYDQDASLRDSAVASLEMTYVILTEDYGRIMDLEAVAEQSYDAMEAYLLAQEIADQKHEESNERLDKTVDAFAATHDVTLVDTEDKLSEKAAKAVEVNNYYHRIFLIFFKSFKQEAYLLEAVNKKNISQIEQNKNTLDKFANEGIAKLATVPSYNGDNALKNACRQMLDFYKSESDKMQVYTDFYLKTENFQKLKEAFENKKDRTQQDVDEYNKAVNTINNATNQFNSVNNNLNANRSKLQDHWNKAGLKFLDKYVPHYK